MWRSRLRRSGKSRCLMSLMFSLSSTTIGKAQVLIKSLIPGTFMLGSLYLVILALYFNLVDWGGTDRELRGVSFYSFHLYTSTVLRDRDFVGPSRFLYSRRLFIVLVTFHSRKANFFFISWQFSSNPTRSTVLDTLVQVLHADGHEIDGKFAESQQIECIMVSVVLWDGNRVGGHQFNQLG